MTSWSGISGVNPSHNIGTENSVDAATRWCPRCFIGILMLRVVMAARATAAAGAISGAAAVVFSGAMDGAGRQKNNNK